MSNETEQSSVMTPSRVLETDPPFAVEPRQALLGVPEEGVPSWNETMFFLVWSPEHDVGVWLHVGVVPEILSFFMQAVLLHLLMTGIPTTLSVTNLPTGLHRHLLT